MNIQSLQTLIAPSGSSRIGGRLDIRSDASASSHDVAATPSSPPTEIARPPAGLEGAGLLRVLSPQEQQSLAAAFTTGKAPVYSGNGDPVDEPSILGTQLDLRA